MKQYLKQCDTKDDYTIWKYSDAPDTHTAYIANGDEVVYGHPENVDEYYYEPLSMEILNSDYNGNCGLHLDNLITEKSNDGKDPYIKYSYDNKTWYDGSDPIIPKNGKVYIATNMAHSGEGINIRPTEYANFKVAGNILSIGGGLEMELPEDVKIKYSFTDGYNSGVLANAENLWMPYWAINDNFQSCNKAPHIVISKSDFSNDTVWRYEHPDIKSADISNVVIDFPKTLKIKRQDEGDGYVFCNLFALNENNQTAVPYKFPQVMSFSCSDSSQVIIEKTYMNRTIAPLTQNYYILSKFLGINQMFDGAQITDLSKIHIMGEIRYDWTQNTFANSSVEKAAKLYTIGGIHSDIYSNSPNLTDVYYYSYRLPDNLGISTDFAGNIHYAPWLNRDSLTDKQAQYTNATWVEDTDAILVMTWKFTEGDQVDIDGTKYFECYQSDTDQSYPFSMHFEAWSYTGLELFDNVSLISHVIINDEWLPLTYVEKINLSYVDWYKFSYTYNNETHYIYYRHKDENLTCRKDCLVPVNLVFSNNLPDELKFKYINA